MNQTPTEEKSTYSMDHLNHKSVGLMNQTPTKNHLHDKKVGLMNQTPTIDQAPTEYKPIIHECERWV